MKEEFINHLEESKGLLVTKADEIMLNDSDLEDDNRPFSPLLQKNENSIIQDHLRDLTNARLDDFEKLSPMDSEFDEYFEMINSFLKQLVRERL